MTGHDADPYHYELCRATDQVVTCNRRYRCNRGYEKSPASFSVDGVGPHDTEGYCPKHR